jgi:hypothetical protein
MRTFAMTPTFAYNAACESLAKQHMDELEADAKAKPVIAQEMSAGVFDEDKLLELMQEA